MATERWKTFDCIVGLIVLIGGLNWGLVGMFGFDLVTTIFGEMTILTRLVYTLVGLCALYDILFIRAIWHRWDVHFRKPMHA
jgi:uncharacterized membrane protein YuzA (DUF378 family)